MIRKFNKYCIFACIISLFLTSYPVLSSSSLFLEDSILAKSILISANAIGIFISFFSFLNIFDCRITAVLTSVIWTFSGVRLYFLYCRQSLRADLLFALLPALLLCFYLVIKEFKIYRLFILLAIAGVCAPLWKMSPINPPGLQLSELFLQFALLPNDSEAYTDISCGMGLIPALSVMFFIVTLFLESKDNEKKLRLFGTLLIPFILCFLFGTLFLSPYAYIGFLTICCIYFCGYCLIYIKNHFPDCQYIGYIVVSFQVVSNGFFLLDILTRI